MAEESFMQHLTGLSAPMIDDPSLVQKRGFNPQRPLEQSEEYVRDNLLALSQVELLIKQLKQAARYMSSYRSVPAIKKKEFTRYDHIVYHLEVHLLKTTSVLDRLLILVNLVLGLNAEQKKCKAAYLLHPKNGKTEYKKKIESYPGLRHALLKLEAYIEPYREDRNMIAHHKNIDYSELRAVEMYSVLLGLDIGDDTDFLSNFKVVAKVELTVLSLTLKNYWKYLIVS